MYLKFKKQDRTDADSASIGAPYFSGERISRLNLHKNMHLFYRCSDLVLIYRKSLVKTAAVSI